MITFKDFINEGDSRSLDKLEQDIHMIMHSSIDPKEKDKKIVALDKEYRRKGGKKSLGEIEMLTNESKINEGISIPLKDEYAKQIWDNHQGELMKLVDTINAQDFDYGSSEIICDALSEIFKVLADKPGQAYNYMNK